MKMTKCKKRKHTNRWPKFWMYFLAKLNLNTLVVLYRLPLFGFKLFSKVFVNFYSEFQWVFFLTFDRGVSKNFLIYL